MFQLLAKKDISKISTKELCEVDGINRSTFFHHNGQPEDVLHEAEKDAMDERMLDLGQLSPRWIPKSVPETFSGRFFRRRKSTASSSISLAIMFLWKNSRRDS